MWSGHFRERGKSQAPAYSVSDKGPHDRLKPFMVFQPNPVGFNSWNNPSQAFTEKHVSYPRLTATVLHNHFNGFRVCFKLIVTKTGNDTIIFI